MFASSRKKSIHVQDELVAVKSDLRLLAPSPGDPSAPRLLSPGGGLGSPNPYAAHVRGPDTPPRPWTVALRLLLLLGLLYLFVSSLGLLASSFRLVGGRTASAVFQQSSLLGNPVVGLMIGVLVTVLVQSSSTSSSIIVSMVAADFLDVRTAIPIIMGANIGTSVTNTLVSLGQMANRQEFERAFAGATVHDVFNWLCVLVLLPLESATGYLYVMSSAVLAGFNFEHSDGMKVELLSKLTKPFTSRIVQLDKSVLNGWALNDPSYQNATLLRRLCETGLENSTELVTCPSVAAHVPLSDTAVGLLLMAFSLLLLCSCLVSIVKILGTLLKGSVASLIQRVLNSDIPLVPWLTGYLAILVGACMTFLLQSSSIFTSSLTPLVGLGLISLERVYPLTLGSNLGTTTTALLAALSAEGNRLMPAIQVALVHLFFNLSGIALFYVVPFMRIPIPLAKIMGKTTATYRWFAVFYMIMAFAVVPAIVFLLSLGGPVVMYATLCPVAVILSVVVLVNVMQRKCPAYLPAKLHSWYWLPLPLRSLEPLDRLISSLACCCGSQPRRSSHHYVAASNNGTEMDNDSGIHIVVHSDRPTDRANSETQT